METRRKGLRRASLPIEERGKKQGGGAVEEAKRGKAGTGKRSQHPNRWVIERSFRRSSEKKAEQGGQQNLEKAARTETPG